MYLASIRSTDPWRALAALLVGSSPIPALAQSSPFMTGATALQTNILAWLTPVAIILVMALGAMAMANRLAWGWCIGAILGIAIAFGGPQIVYLMCAKRAVTNRMRESRSFGPVRGRAAMSWPTW